ncbi:MAG: hypothetical protein NTW48_10125 [Chloroflexi bacterium]|nr:hypothetical protein [Chloroflexota bacterium]
MAIESDVRDSDSRLAVKFHSKPIKNEFASAQEGRPIFVDRDMITIYVPGDNTLTVDAEVRDDHKARFPLQWAHYQNKHGDDPRNIGTPISEWPLVTQAVAEELRAMKFYTVESIASASDAQISSMGMKAGMNPIAFRTRAQNYLKVASDESVSAKQEEELKTLREENAKIQASSEAIKLETDAKLAVMQAQMTQLLATVGQNSEPKKRGNPNFGKKPEEDQE